MESGPKIIISDPRPIVQAAMKLERSRSRDALRKFAARIMVPALIGFALLDIFGKRVFNPDIVVGAEYGLLFVSSLVLLNLWFASRK